jgi:hypothetical protein
MNEDGLTGQTVDYTGSSTLPIAVEIMAGIPPGAVDYIYSHKMEVYGPLVFGYVESTSIHFAL